MPARRRRIGIVGYGEVGKYLVPKILSTDRPELELAFVYNRSADKFKHAKDLPKEYILQDLSQFAERRPDLIVEVAHPQVSYDYGTAFLKVADYMIGSPTALANEFLEKDLRLAATEHGLYIPSGAFWGGEDILKMADRGTLKALKVTMKKHPDCFNLHEGSLLHDRNLTAVNTNSPVTLYDGPVRDLCPKAPNNVNTMAAAAMTAHNLGFDRVAGCLVADPSLSHSHVVEIDVWGEPNPETGRAFHAHTSRTNPAKAGAITGSATYDSFFSSMLRAKGKGPGVHLC